MTTTDSIEGYKIVRYLGIVGGESVNSAWFGGGSKTQLHASIQQAVNDLRQTAEAAGANAIVGVVIDQEGMLQNRIAIVAYGTAVVVQPTQEPPPVLPPLPGQ
jgi:uncharacterized protein YbjQ (UPF0145 family)